MPDATNESLLRHIRDHFEASAETKRRYAAEHADQLVTVAGWVADCFAAGGKLLLCGNGGSAAEAQHIAAEFTSVLSQTFPRRALPAISLTTDSSFLTARGNDYGFDSVFSRQLEALGRPGDLLFAYTTSGQPWATSFRKPSAAPGSSSSWAGSERWCTSRLIVPSRSRKTVGGAASFTWSPAR